MLCTTLYRIRENKLKKTPLRHTHTHNNTVIIHNSNTLKSLLLAAIWWSKLQLIFKCSSSFQHKRAIDICGRSRWLFFNHRCLIVSVPSAPLTIKTFYYCNLSFSVISAYFYSSNFRRSNQEPTRMENPVLFKSTNT